MESLSGFPDSPFTWSGARAAGVTRRELELLVRTRHVRRVLHGVYADAVLTDTVELRAAAAGLVLPTSGVFVDRTAAWLHGVDVLDFRELEILPPLECVVLPDRHRVERAGCRGGERDLAPYDMCVIGGVRVTTPLRTALDLGCKLPRPDALAALDMFMRLHGIARMELEASLPRYRGRRGVIKLRELVALADARSESPGESRTRLAIHDADIPAPRPQHWVHHQGQPLFRLDLAYPRHRVAVEYDGEEWHERTEAQRTADRERRAWLRRHGWTVVVVRRGDFSGEAKAAWISELREALHLV